MIEEKNYSDRNRENTKDKLFKNQYSKYCNKIFYKSKIDGIKLGMLIIKPNKPSYILASTHGWHMTIPPYYINNDKPSDYLTIFVDMRGRKYSEGKPDCNGYELMDIIDAIEYCKKYYKKYLINTETIYFEGGSGGGGNAYSLIAKFPDYFSSINCLCGITDYSLWYKNDSVGEFRDELKPWIGFTPSENKVAYDSRSGIYGVENIYTYVFMAHGSDDIRVPCYHARNYYQKAKDNNKLEFIKYFEIKNTGGVDHWTNISETNKQKLEELCELNRKLHKKPIMLPKKGRLKILGFLVTKYFEIYFDDINTIGYVDYDIEKSIYKVESPSKRHYKFINKIK